MVSCVTFVELLFSFMRYPKNNHLPAISGSSRFLRGTEGDAKAASSQQVGMIGGHDCWYKHCAAFRHCVAYCRITLVAEVGQVGEFYRNFTTRVKRIRGQDSSCRSSGHTLESCQVCERLKWSMECQRKDLERCTTRGKEEPSGQQTAFDGNVARLATVTPQKKS